MTRPIIAIPAVTAEETARLQAVSGALATRIAWDRILREFSLVVPDDVSITTLNLTAPPTVAAVPGEAPAATPTGLVLIGTTYSHDSVARLLERLMLIPDLTDVTLTSSTASTSGGRHHRPVQHRRERQGRAGRAHCRADDADGHHDHERVRDMKNAKLSRPAAIALIIGGDLLLLVLGWVLLVSPQRTNAASIAKATQAAEAQIVEAQRAIHEAPPKAPKQPLIRTAGLYQLAKAMPESTDMPDVLLELDQVARASGVVVGTVTPQPAAPAIGLPYSTVQIQLIVGGNFYALTDLLYRLNSLVSVRDGELDSSGRLFSVNSISVSKSGAGNLLNATVTVTAYVYGTADASAAAGTPATTPAPTDTTSTGTDTTSTTAPSSDVAPQP